MAESNNIIKLSLYSNILFLIAISAAAALSTNETDIQALLDIKNHIQNSQILDSWNHSIHFCNWKGITCGRKHKRVTALDISALHLVGTLSPSIGNLTFLQGIDLTDNSFHGPIPPQIGRLFRLQYLSFANNLFQDQFPTNITLCKRLQFIDLGKNKLNGRIPPVLGNISTLQTLDISNNNLSGNIPHELGKLFNLQWLALSLNVLSGSIPVEIYNISSIQTLSIADNLLTGRIPDTLGLTLPKITNFVAGYNNFSGSIPSTLANASGLVHISIGGNMLTGPIPRNLGRLQKLQVLEIDDNPDLGTDRANDISFIATLTNCTDLNLLGLGKINIGGVLPLEIANLSRNLEYLYLDDNYISGTLAEGVGELVGLTLFYVSNNILSGSIPLSICKLQNLVRLFLSVNNFTGQIPPCIGDISGLEILALYQNKLTGNIPVSLRNVTKLRYLNLGQNHLHGSLTKEVFSITSLTLWLGLAQNKFTGSLPSEVGNLKFLVALDVAENELSGEIPQSIGGCVMMQNLWIEGNLLSGMIPFSLGQLKSIQVIDLSRNKLSGKIPASLENLTLIRTLNLSFNMLEGEVPRNGVLANQTALSLVGNDKLCGGIESLKLPVCPPNDTRKHGKISTHIIVILVLCISLALVSLSGCAYAIYRSESSKKVPCSTPAYGEKRLQISYAEIHNSTKGFSSENLIGDGKYGSVYRGVLIAPCEKEVAIKVLKLQQLEINPMIIKKAVQLESEERLVMLLQNMVWEEMYQHKGTFIATESYYWRCSPEEGLQTSEKIIVFIVVLRHLFPIMWLKSLIHGF